MTTEVQNTIKYVGIADAHGLESFCLPGKDTGWLPMRASLNRQRHAVYYEVELTDKQVKDINDLLSSSLKNRFKMALVLLKRFVAEGAECSLAGNMGDVVGSFKMIPNPALDPWYKGDDDE